MTSFAAARFAVPGVASPPPLVFLLAYHERQPSLPLLTLYDKSSTEGDLPIFKHGRPLVGFDDYEGSELRASCDGLLLLSLSGNRFFICNPATRQSAPLPCLTAEGHINIAALYLHRPSGEYRVLYLKGTDQDHPKAAYYILVVRREQSPRCIGVPSDIPSIQKVMLACHETHATYLAPPVFSHNCLHWDSGWGGSEAGILVFDTLVESFRLMRCPASATRYCNRLCDMEGSIGFSCNVDGGSTDAKIWVLEDYKREVWSFKYHVKFHLENDDGYDIEHLALSHKGDLLVYMPSCGYMFHYDNTGKIARGIPMRFRGFDHYWTLVQRKPCQA